MKKMTRMALAAPVRRWRQKCVGAVMGGAEMEHPAERRLHGHLSTSHDRPEDHGQHHRADDVGPAPDCPAPACPRPTPKSQMKWRMPPSMWWMSAQVIAEQHDEPEPRAEHGIGEIERAGPARRRRQPPDQQHRAEIERDAGDPVDDRHRHGHRPAIDLEVRRKRAVRLDVGVRHASVGPRRSGWKRRSFLAPMRRRVKSLRPVPPRRP